MNYLESKSADIDLFVNRLERFVVLIGDPSMCKGVVKSINVIKNKNCSGVKSIKRNIRDDFRMIYDRGQYCGEVKVIFDDIEKLLKKCFSDT